MKIISLHKNVNLSNKKAVKRLQAKDREMQNKVFAFYSPKMLGVCRQYIKDLQQAEEIMLNGFLKVFTKINSYNGSGNFEGWIRRIMVNECISFLRVKKNIFLVEEESTFTEKCIEQEGVEKTLNIDYLQNIIDNLKTDLKIVFNLYVIEEYKHKEIAEMLNISINASKLRYRKAKQQLQKQIELNKLHYGK